MSDHDLPDLPSDEELGITEEDRKLLEEQLGDEDEPPIPDEAEVKPASGRKPAKRKTSPAGSAAAPPAKGAPPAALAGSAGFGWRGPLTLALLVLMAWATGSQRALPDAVPLGVPDSVFSSGRAMLDVVDIARRAHPPGSPQHARVRAMLVERLQALGLVPEVQTATSLRRRGERVAGATVRNVLARVPGTASTGAVLLTAHYDSRGIARGAGDDGSGVATILEVLRAVRAGPPLRNDLIVLITDAEELGFLGARAFVEDHPWLDDVAVVLSIEMRGGGGPSNMFETGSENGWIVGAMADGDPRPFANSIFTEIYRRMPNDTDFSPFRDRGIQGLNFAGIGNAHVYHQPWDAPERLDERTLQHHGLHVLGMVRELGGRDLSEVDGPDRPYFTVPVLGLVSYPQGVGYGLGMLLLILAAGVFFLVRRGGLRKRASEGGAPPAGGVIGGFVVGFVLALVAAAATAAAGHFLFRGVRGFHPEYGALHGSAFHVEGWYVAAVVAVGLAVTVASLHLARRRFSLGPLALGAITPPLLAALFLTFAAPLAAQNLQWPVLLALVAVIPVAGVTPGRRPGVLAWLGALVLTAGIAVIAVPLTELVWLALSFAAAAIVGGLVALWLVLLLPLLDTLREPGGWWVPLTGLVAAVVFAGVGLAHAKPTAERPAPSTLLYVLDRDSAAAVWATSGDLSPRNGGRRGAALPGIPAADRDEGIAWAVARTGVAVEELAARVSLERFLLGPDSVYRTGSAPAEGIPAPAVSVEVAPGTPGVASATSRRRVRLAVHSAVGAEMITVTLPGSADVFLEAVNGREIPGEDPADRSGARRVTTVEHWGTPPASPASDGGPGEEAGALALSLDVGPGVGALPVEIVEHHLRPGELVGERHFLRPPALAPDIVRRSDRAILRTTVTVEPATGVVSGPPASSGAAAPPALPPGAVPARADTTEPDTTGTLTTEPDSAAAAIEPDTTTGGA